MLRRSPLLLGILIAYPLVIALLVGLVASYGSAKPRVAFVDEDNLPSRSSSAARLRRQPHDRPGGQEREARAPLPGRGLRELADGRVVAVVTVPPGFVSTLRGMVRSPQLELQVSTGTISSRVEQQVQALVYSLNRQLQRAYIARQPPYMKLILHGGDGSFLGAPITCSGSRRRSGCCARCRRRRGRRSCSISSMTRASRSRTRTTRSARRRTRSSSACARARAHVGALGGRAGLRTRR